MGKRFEEDGGASSRNSNPEGYGRLLAGDSEKRLIGREKSRTHKEISTSVQLRIYRSTESEPRGSDVFTEAGD